MTGTSDSPIPIYDVKMGHVATRDITHCTGGLRAQRVGSARQLGPVYRDGAFSGIEIDDDAKLGPACGLLGVVIVGAEEIAEVEAGFPCRIWTPLLTRPRPKHQPADTWGMIASNASIQGDKAYAQLAHSVSASLRASGLRLRDASDQYYLQLISALRSGKKIGHKFGNIQMLDLHLAFHSLLAEMASARDYLAQIVGRKIGAPEEKDSLARLLEWAKKPAQAQIVNDPLFQAFATVADKKSADPWLADLTEYRNVFLHREPIMVNDLANRFTVLEVSSPSFGMTHRLRLPILVRSGSADECEAFDRFAVLHDRLSHLADFTAQHAKYEPKPLHFGAPTS
jgi:hypothetical protein